MISFDNLPDVFWQFQRKADCLQLQLSHTEGVGELPRDVDQAGEGRSDFYICVWEEVTY